MKVEKIDVKKDDVQNVFLKLAVSSGKRGFDDAKLRTLELVAKTSCVCDEGFSDSEKAAAKGAVEAFRNAISRAITLLEFGGTGLGVFAVEGPVGDDAANEESAETESGDAEETDGEATAETVADAE
ncbi:MAG: hypothetical protein IKU86_06240 [Thermoguttaceae bacterium]|nr:hypothetical protein [Thermoguttaceae bacterium]